MSVNIFQKFCGFYAFPERDGNFQISKWLHWNSLSNQFCISFYNKLKSLGRGSIPVLIQKSHVEKFVKQCLIMCFDFYILVCYDNGT